MEIYTVQKIINLLNDMKITNMKGSKLYYSDIYSVIKKLKLSPVYVTQTENDHLLYWYSREQVDKIIKERLRIMKKRNVIKKQNTYSNQMKITEERKTAVLPEQEYLNCYSTSYIVKVLKKEGITKNTAGSKLTNKSIRNMAEKRNIKPIQRGEQGRGKENLYSLDDTNALIKEAKALFGSCQGKQQKAKPKAKAKEVQNKEVEKLYDKLVGLEEKMNKLILDNTVRYDVPKPEPEIRYVEIPTPKKKGFFARLFGRSGK